MTVRITAGQILQGLPQLNNQQLMLCLLIVLIVFVILLLVFSNRKKDVSPKREIKKPEPQKPKAKKKDAKKKKERHQEEEQTEQPDEATEFAEDATELADDATELADDATELADDGATELADDQPGGIRLTLRSMTDPSVRLEHMVYDQVSIGRQVSLNDMVTPVYMDSISRRQCVVTNHDGALWISNVSSHGTTWLDGVPVQTEAQLYSGAVLELGARHEKFQVTCE